MNQSSNKEIIQQEKITNNIFYKPSQEEIDRLKQKSLTSVEQVNTSVKNKLCESLNYLKLEPLDMLRYRQSKIIMDLGDAFKLIYTIKQTEPRLFKQFKQLLNDKEKELFSKVKL